MKNKYVTLAVVALLLSFAMSTAATAAPNAPAVPDGPIGGYVFANSTGTYTPLVGATPFTINGGGGTLDDGYSAAQTLPFTFNFGGADFTTLVVNTNGWLAFGSTTATTNYSALNGTVNNVLAFVNRDLNNSGAVYGTLTEGTAPNRIYKIEAANFYRYNTSTMTGTVQVWLYETTNVVELHYGPFAQTWTSGTTVQVGLRGTSTGTTDVRSLSGTDWASAVAGNSSTATMPLALTVTPDNGRIYQFTPSAAAPILASSTKSAAQTFARSGAPVTYTVVLNNTGDAAADNATLSDPIPTGSTYIAGSVATQGGPAATYNSGTNAIEWGPSAIAAAGRVTVTFGVTVNIAPPGSITNTATISATNLAEPVLKTAVTPLVGCYNDASYVCTDSLQAGGPTFTWYDATTGTLILDATTTAGDDREANVTLPFPFAFYGVTSDAIRVGDNGAILFGQTTGDVGFSNTAMSGAPAQFIAPFWDDMDTDTGGTYGQVFGTAPNRVYVVEWYDRPHYTNVGAGSFEVLFYEGTNDLVFQYQDVVFGNVSYDYGASATVGIRGATIQYQYNQPALQDSLAIRFDPFASADLGVSVAASAAVVLPGGALNYDFTVANAGPDAATNAVMSATLPTQWVFGSGSVSQGACVLSAGLLDCAFGDVASAGTVTLVLTGTVDAGAACPATLAFDTTVASDIADPNPANNTASSSVSLLCTAPVITVAPTSLALTVPQGYTASIVQTLTISNTGNGILNWNITEDSTPAAVQPADARSAPDKSGRDRVRHAANPDAILISEGFEGGVVPPAGWTRVTTNASYSWKIMVVGTPYAGAYSADVEYDPALVPQDEWLLSPELSLSSGTLTFWSQGSVYWCRDNYDNCDLNVWLVVGDPGGGDDVFVGKGDDVWPANWTWTQSTFDLTPLLPGGPVRIGFEYTGTDGAQIALDEIILDGTAGADCDGVSDIPWLAANPTSGATAAGASSTVDVTYSNMSALAVNTYTADLCVNSDDPVNPVVVVPVTLTIRAPTAVDMTAFAARTAAPLGLLVPAAGALLALAAFVIVRKRRA